MCFFYTLTAIFIHLKNHTLINNKNKMLVSIQPDIVTNNISIMYKRVVPSNFSASKAELLVNYNPKDGVALFQFEVPNFVPQELI